MAIDGGSTRVVGEYIDYEVLQQGKSVDRLSESIPNEFSAEAVELHCAA